MQDGQARALNRLRGTATAKADVRAAAKSRLEKLVSAVGNEEISKRIEQGNATRDQMLAFVLQQLESARELQQREQALARKDANYDWWRLAQNTVAEPHPTRWKSVAASFEQAVDAICKGDLKRGQRLLEAAVVEQERITADMSALVDRKDLTADVDPGEIAILVAETPAAGSCAVPGVVRDLLDRIDGVEQTVPTMPDEMRVNDPWWTLEEEEDEEDGNGGGGGAG